MRLAPAKPAPLSGLPVLLWFDPAGGLLPSRPQNISADARSGGQGRPARHQRGFLAASRPLLDGREHAGPIVRSGLSRQFPPHQSSIAVDLSSQHAQAVGFGSAPFPFPLALQPVGSGNGKRPHACSSTASHEPTNDQIARKQDYSKASSC
jgi:hypothetical protein